MNNNNPTLENTDTLDVDEPDLDGNWQSEKERERATAWGVPDIVDDAPDRTLFWGVMAITAMGLVLRLWNLGERALHHDESLDAWWSDKFIDGTFDGYDPVFHGPLRFYITGWFYQIFGESPATARLFAALTGALLVAIPWYMRRELGRAGTIASSIFLALSPSMLYFSRFGREDAQIMFLSGVMLALAANFIRRPRFWQPPAFALALSSSFAIKESTYLWVGIIGSFGVCVLAVQYAKLRSEGLKDRLDDPDSDAPLRAPAAPSLFDFEVAFPALALLGLLAAILIGGFAPGGVFLMIGVFAICLMGAMIWQLMQAYSAGFTIFDAPIADTLRKAGMDSWLLAAGLFIISFIAFFTVWFKFPGDWYTGVTEAIGYWDSQQDVNRGGQPWYYYLVAIPAYEWFFMLLGAVGLRRAWRERTFMNGLFVWVTVASFILYSYAGERMPWLIVHPLLPILFLAGLGVQELWENRRTGAVLGLSALLVLGFAFTTFTSLRASFVTDTDGRELFVQAGQATEHVTEMLEEIERLDRVSRAEFGRPLRLGLGADDAWPWAYYLKDYSYTTWDASISPEVPADLDVLIANNYIGNRASYFEPTNELPDHEATRFALRVWWVPANKADEDGNFSASVSYFDTTETNLLARVGEWADWAITKDASWKYEIGGGCGSVDQWFMVSNELRAAADRTFGYLETPEIPLLPCASDDMSYSQGMVDCLRDEGYEEATLEQSITELNQLALQVGLNEVCTKFNG